MQSSVMNGAIGKSPAIDRINQMTAEEMGSRTTARIEECVCRNGSAKYMSANVSFSACKDALKSYIEASVGEGGNADL